MQRSSHCRLTCVLLLCSRYSRCASLQLPVFTEISLLVGMSSVSATRTSRLFSVNLAPMCRKLCRSILSELGTGFSMWMRSVSPGGGPDANGSRGSIRAATVKCEPAAGPASSVGAAGFQHGWIIARWAARISHLCVLAPQLSDATLIRAA